MDTINHTQKESKPFKVETDEWNFDELLKEFDEPEEVETLRVEEETEDFQFRPITKGLGFHQKEKEAKLTLEESVRNPYVSKPQVFEKETHMGLEAFVGGLSQERESKTLEAPQEKFSLGREKRETQNFVTSARPVDRLVAFVLDLIFCALLNVSFISILGLSLGLSSREIMDTVGTEVAIGFLVSTYLIYFSLFDLYGTLGKQVLGISLYSEGGRASLTQTFGRSLLTLFSLVFLGIPSLLGFTDNWTKTQVCE